MLHALARLALALGVAAGALAPAHADRAREQEDARKAVERGEALPLVELLGRIRAQLGGELVGVSFERKHGRWVYEFKVVGEGGQIEEVYVDAATAEILKREGR
ncbi:peptidase [Alsobacter soli]|uniref:Peptidase n=1 Tax=Alsobacter soli TaxID=2109933 RepID=A0A2T1HXB7_9HYPH|nr:PepSY domain-containing protein [Alsobacter soli]PSC06311.1 peptidase [Alsobacter soli]